MRQQSFQRMGGRHFGIDVLAGFQGLRRQGALLFAANRQRYRIHVRVCEKVVVPCIGRYRIRVFQDGKGWFMELGDGITDRGDPITIETVQRLQPVTAAPAETGKADTNFLHNHSPILL